MTTKVETAKTLVRIARQGYGAHIGEEMCVGKAFMIATVHCDFYHGLPTPDEVAVALARKNPDLTSDLALSYATEICHHNDTGRIALAWDVLEDALAHDERSNHERSEGRPRDPDPPPAWSL